jgi:hypothetical protein
MKPERIDPASALPEAFRAQALQRPRAEALRLRQHGAWRRLSWSELAVRVDRAAQGWAALGVSQGDTVVAVGALGEAFIVTLIAVQVLGAQMRVEEESALDAVIARARFVLAQGTREVDRVSMHRSASLQALVVENDFGAEPSADLVPVAWQHLIEGEGVAVSARGDAAPEPALAPQPLHPGAAWRTVLADFPLHWLPGLRWLMTSWPVSGATLVVAEARGDTSAQLIEARPELWIASAQALAAFAAAGRSRVPASGLGAIAVRAALADGRGVLRSAARWRLRQVLGLGSVRAVLTEAQALPAAVVMVQRLGAAVDFDAPLPAEPLRPRPAAPAAAPPSAWAEPFEPALDRAAP